MKIRFIEIVLLLALISCHSGSKKEFYENGSLKAEYHVLNKEISGLAKFYFRNGELRELSNWSNGERNGYFAEYYKNGNKKNEGSFVDGKLDGKFKMYDSLGNYIGVETYNLGILEGPFSTYYSDGSLKSKGIHLNHIDELIKKEYYADGRLKSYYYKRNPDVEYLRYYTNDKSVSSFHYPLKVNQNENTVCLELLHSMIPKDSLKVAIFIGSTKDKSRTMGVKNNLFFESNGNSVCFDKEILDSSSFEGFFCEIFSPLNSLDGYMPFVCNLDSNEISIAKNSGAQFLIEFKKQLNQVN